MSFEIYRLRRILLPVLIVAGLFATVRSASPAVAPKQSVENTNQALVELAKENREALKEQRELLEKQADRHLAHINSILNLSLWVFGGVVILAGVGLAFVFGKSFRDLRSTIKTTFDNQTKRLIDAEVTELRGMLRALKQEVVSAQQYRSARVMYGFSLGELLPWGLSNKTGSKQESRVNKKYWRRLPPPV